MTTITVSTSSSLLSALRSAHAGDTILLAAGTYSGVALNNFNFSSAVTIQSADPLHQAVINNLSVSGSSGLTFSQLNIASTGGMAANVNSSHNITFNADIFHGTSTGDGDAMMIRDSDSIVVKGSDFGSFSTGINELSSSNITITGNTFHAIDSGAIRGTGVTNETISGNTFADAKASVSDHSDVINLWQDNTANHVTIGSNTFGSTTTGSTSGSTGTGSTGTGSTGTGSTGTGSTGTGSTSGGSHATVTVSNTTDLLSAVQHAHAGDTILLAAGTYNGVALNNLNFSSAVTIQSADASHEAIINNLKVSGSTGLTFSQLNIVSTGGVAATVGSSHSIAFVNDIFHGTSTGAGDAMMIRGSDAVTVTGSTFSSLGTGINELNDNNLTISNNTFHDISGGAIRGTGVTNEAISGNTFADANASVSDHSDVINLWQDNTANHVTLSGNTFGATNTGSTGAGSTGTGSTGTDSTQTGSTGTGSTGTGSTSGAVSGSTSGATTGGAATGGTGATVTVGSVADLQKALASAHAGDTILLKAGVYDGVDLSDLHFSSSVTIASADSAHQAVINNLVVDSSSGLALKGLNVEITGSSSYAVDVENSSNISMDGLTVHGTGNLDGVGLFVRDSNGVSLTNSDVSNLQSGLAHLDDSGLTISGNTFHNIDTDGVIGAGSAHVVVSNNTFTDFHPSAGAHPDAIQFFDTDQMTTDVLISGNVITRGAGEVSQGIFIEGGSNFTIVDNAMAGTMYNGISLSGTEHALIEGNFVEGYTDMDTWIMVRGGSSDVTVVGNTAQSVVNYVDSGVVNTNFVASGNTIISAAAVGDLTALNNWLSQHTGVTAALTGGLGADTLTGTAGADVMAGGAGNDVYLVNNAGDVVTEAANAGIDTVHSSIASYTLGANVENLVLTGTTAQTGIGNALDNVLVGNGVQSVLNGGAGDDVLISIGGASTLTGGAGSDVFTIAATPSSAVQITDFTAGQDKLDLHLLLANYHGSDPVADNWVQFQNSSSGVTVLVDVDGPSGSAGYVAVAKLAGVSSLSAADWVFH